MKKIPLFLLMMCFVASLFAQNEGQFTTAAESDPEAKVVLEKLKKKYNGLEKIEADFTLTIEIPEEDKIVQKGTMAQKGNQYRLDMPEQSIISDGTTLWFHLKGNNEVQINDAEEMMDDESFMSPQKIIEMYENGDFIYILADQYSKGATVIQQIEFKPVDRDADVFKIRVTVDKKANTIKELKAFSKDGSRYTIDMQSFNTNPTFAKGHFTFDPSKFDDIYVEDLRM